MRSIAELSRGQASLSTDPNMTKYSTTGFTSMQPTIWAAEILRFAESIKRLDQIVKVDKSMVGNKSEKVTFPTTESHQSITTSPIDTTYPEGTVRNFTILGNAGTVTATILNTDFLKGAIGVSKELMMTCSVDVVAEAREAIALDIADDVDLALATALQSTSVTNQLWGGDATQVEDLTDGDVITTDLVADSKRQLGVNNFVNQWLVISPYQEATFLKDSQFVNVAEYGSNEVVMKGEIGRYLNFKIIVTTNANMQYTSDDVETNEAATVPALTNGMTTCIAVGDNRKGQKSSVVLAWKEMPHIDMEFKKNEARHQIYYDQAFTTALIHLEAISLIKVANT